MPVLGVLNAISRDATDGLAHGDVPQQIGQNWRIPNAVPRHLDSHDFKRFGINATMEFAPLTAPAGAPC